MKIAMIGRGAMGKLVATLAEQKGHEISAVIGCDAGSLPALLHGADVAIDFSVAGAVADNVKACLAAGVALVEGTTGWNDRREELLDLTRSEGGAMVYGANFSIGVNLFYRVAGFASGLFASVGGYEAFLEEQHHSRKKDAPSGTGLKLKEIVDQAFSSDHEVASTRAGNIPGTHRVGFDGTADQIVLEHVARSREGFAAGAILAAAWIVGKKGVYEFSEVMDDILERGL